MPTSTAAAAASPPPTSTAWSASPVGRRPPAGARRHSALTHKLEAQGAELERLLKETERRNAELAVINGIQQAVSAALDFQGIVDVVGDKLREVFGTGDLSICWWTRLRSGAVPLRLRARRAAAPSSKRLEPVRCRTASTRRRRRRSSALSRSSLRSACHSGRGPTARGAC
jgi:hypothetical protein